MKNIFDSIYIYIYIYIYTYTHIYIYEYNIYKQIYMLYVYFII